MASAYGNRAGSEPRTEVRTFENRHGGHVLHAPGERARQFKPFAALRGFEQLVREQELVDEPRRLMTPERARSLSECVAQLERGMMVEVLAYTGRGYERFMGAFVQVDQAEQSIVLVSGRYLLSDIADVRVVSQEDGCDGAEI